jgi:hypothetical protein
MNIYLLSQNVNNDYDTYDSCVVVAKSSEEAILIHPRGRLFKDFDKTSSFEGLLFSSDWANPEEVNCELIGKAKYTLKLNSVICASFNAG